MQAYLNSQKVATVQSVLIKMPLWEILLYPMFIINMKDIEQVSFSIKILVIVTGIQIVKSIWKVNEILIILQDLVLLWHFCPKWRICTALQRSRAMYCQTLDPRVTFWSDWRFGALQFRDFSILIYTVSHIYSTAPIGLSKLFIRLVAHFPQQPSLPGVTVTAIRIFLDARILSPLHFTKYSLWPICAFQMIKIQVSLSHEELHDKPGLYTGDGSSLLCDQSGSASHEHHTQGKRQPYVSVIHLGSVSTVLQFFCKGPWQILAERFGITASLRFEIQDSQTLDHDSTSLGTFEDVALCNQKSRLSCNFCLCLQTVGKMGFHNLSQTHNIIHNLSLRADYSFLPTKTEKLSLYWPG